MCRTKRIENGIVIDHVSPGKGLELYNLLKLNHTDCPTIIIKNVDSRKMGKKDMIKICDIEHINLDIIGYFSSDITVNIIQNQKISKIRNIDLPEYIKNVLYCKNINCITSVEPEIDHIFKLVNRKNKKYACVYCDNIE